MKSSPPPPASAPLNEPRAIVDLDNLAFNYRRVVEELNGIPAAGVVKANGYGLGAAMVAAALAHEGCEVFFVARLDEGIQLRHSLVDNEIHVFDGVLPGTEDALIEADLVPVLNSLDQVERWREAAIRLDRRLPFSLHLDSGMARLGLDAEEQRILLSDVDHYLGRLDARYVMSHLASADVSGSSQSAEQLERFRTQVTSLSSSGLRPAGFSLANSAGVFLGADYHFNLARPGICLYGGSPYPDSGRPNPMRQVLSLEAPIVQIRQVAPGDTVGYGAAHVVAEESTIATIPVGYADGFLRSASGRGEVAIGDTKAPIVGRISMDLITVDVSNVDHRFLYPGAAVELLGPRCPVDDVSGRAGSIPHEFLTGLSTRLRFQYVGELIG